MGKKSKIKKITEKQYMEYVAGLKNEPISAHEGSNNGDAKNGGGKQNRNNR